KNKQDDNGTIFFFQAEDGIRDLTVTGVQTCALPICGVEHHDNKFFFSPLKGKLIVMVFDSTTSSIGSENAGKAIRRYVVPVNTRSEERRVGKECRARRSQCQ